MIDSATSADLRRARALLDADPALARHDLATACATRIDGDPDTEEIPMGHACWRGRVRMTRELLERGAALEFRDGGSAIGAALHGSRHCHDPEGGPSMRTVDEVPREPYREIVQLLLTAGAPVPARIGEHGPRATMLMAELGVDPPA